MDEGREHIVIRAPRWVLFVLVAASAVYFFWHYGTSRVWVTDGEFGFSAGRAASSLVLACMSIPILLTMALAQPLSLAAVLVFGSWAAVTWFKGRKNRRACARGLAPGSRFCEACGYPAAGLREETCPECGGQRFSAVRARHVLRWGPVLLALGIGGSVGLVVSEVRLSLDEAAFRREVTANGGADFSRHRARPFSDGILHYIAGTYTSQGD